MQNRMIVDEEVEETGIEEGEEVEVAGEVDELGGIGDISEISQKPTRIAKEPPRSPTRFSVATAKSSFDFGPSRSRSVSSRIDSVMRRVSSRGSRRSELSQESPSMSPTTTPARRIEFEHSSYVSRGLPHDEYKISVGRHDREKRLEQSSFMERTDYELAANGTFVSTGSPLITLQSSACSRSDQETHGHRLSIPTLSGGDSCSDPTSPTSTSTWTTPTTPQSLAFPDPWFLPTRKGDPAMASSYSVESEVIPR